MALNRKMHRASSRTKDANFSLDGLVGFDLHGKTVTVVGCGKVRLPHIQKKNSIFLSLLKKKNMSLAPFPFPFFFCHDAFAAVVGVLFCLCVRAYYCACSVCSAGRDDADKIFLVLRLLCSSIWYIRGRHVKAIFTGMCCVVILLPHCLVLVVCLRRGAALSCVCLVSSLLCESMSFFSPPVLHACACSVMLFPSVPCFSPHRIVPDPFLF